MDEDEYKQYFGMGAPELIASIAPDLNSQEVKALRELKSQYYKDNFEMIKLNLPLITFLKKAKQTHLIALATMGSKKNVKNLLTHFKLIDYFDYIITRDDVAKSKPNPECLERVMNHLKVGPEECLVFEDPSTGVQAAKNAGMDYIVIKMD